MPRRQERVFLVRMWRNDDAGDNAVWRGRVHDVASGKRFYVTAADVGAFIAESLDAATESRTAFDGDTATSTNVRDAHS